MSILPNRLCRMCLNEHLTTFLDLGFQPPADDFRREDQLEDPVTHYPLRVALCLNCGLSQLTHVVRKETLYAADYPYDSSVTAAGRRHFTAFAADVHKRLRLMNTDLVVDVGSNVGVLLEAFRARGARVLGVDPVDLVAARARARGVDTLTAFFGIGLAADIRAACGRARVVTASNVFAHVDDLWDFMRAVDCVLTDDGVFIFESPDFLETVRHIEFDTIYHEHLSYLSLRPVVSFVQNFGLEVFDVVKHSIHGGSMRVFIGRGGQRPVTAAVTQALQKEADYRLHDLATLRAFAQRVECIRDEMLWLLRSLKRSGCRLAALSAPAKGMSLLNYLRVGRETLDFATEKSDLKIGRFTPGDHIPVLADAELLRRQPDYALLLAWNFADEIMDNLKEYRSRGGKFIIPIPFPKIVT